MEDKKVLLSIKDLQVKFRVRGRILTAIRGVTLDIYENESIAIVGESGAGKSVFTRDGRRYADVIAGMDIIKTGAARDIRNYGRNLILGVRVPCCKPPGSMPPRP